jgi:DNA-binding HxlR family transcriptional regulator
MKQGDTATPALCAPFHHAIELIGRRWTGAVISLLLQSRCRFATLQELESEGIVERTVIPDTPVRVEYSLTKKGKALADAVEAIGDWAHKWGSTPATEVKRKTTRKG